MNSFFCWLTGGHKYADSNLMIHTDHETDEAVFQNICIKCGKPFEIRIGWRYLSIGILCMVPGNHEFRTTKDGDYCQLYDIASTHKPCISIPKEIIDSVLGEDE